MKEHRTFRSYGRESNPDGPILTPRAVSASRSLRGSGSGVSSSLIRKPHSSTMGNSPIEERHPQRSSSPTPDEKRSSPENLYKQSITGHDGAEGSYLTTSVEGMTAKWLKSEISGLKCRTSEEKTGDDSIPTLLKSQDGG
jgi:hypothetical protein